MVTSKENKGQMIFGLIVGILFIFFGFIQLIVGLGFGSEITDAMFIPPDIIGALILILIGTIFLFGVKELNTGMSEGVAYIYVGIFLALLFLAIYLLIMGADAIMTYIIESEDYEGWVPLDSMRPGIYLGIIPLIGFFIWRNKFTLRSLSKAGV